MKKLKLDTDALAVESFPTAQAGPPLGTVHGHGTLGGSTCDAANTCGPQTCGDFYCVIDTQAPCGGGGTGGTGGTNPSGQMSCVGCTTFDYTNQGGDSCDFCASFYTDSPQRCPCI
jgi:hypothetical protein